MHVVHFVITRRPLTPTRDLLFDFPQDLKAVPFHL